MPADADGLAKSTLPGTAIVVGGSTRIVKRMLGSGSYGVVFTVLNDPRTVLKFEKSEEPRAQLCYEARVYGELSQLAGIPRVIGFGAESPPGWNVLAMQRLGPTLEDVYRSGGPMGWRKAGEIGARLVFILKQVHAKGIVHRDIKPHNIAFLRGCSDGQIMVFDWGLAKKVVSSSGASISYREGKSVTGTPRYCSVAAHLGAELNKRDDLESVMYSILYLAAGKLPWQGLKPPEQDSGKRARNLQIAEVKICTPLKQLLRKAPRGWLGFMRRVRRLAFDESPDYDELIDLLWPGDTSSMVDDVIVSAKGVKEHRRVHSSGRVKRKRVV